MTHVGLICDDPMLQAVLPQVFLACGRLVPPCEVVLLEADLPPFVQIWRGNSSWSNTDTMVRLIALLGQTLATHAAGALAILIMDAAKVHLSARVHAGGLVALKVAALTRGGPVAERRSWREGLAKKM